MFWSSMPMLVYDGDGYWFMQMIDDMLRSTCSGVGWTTMALSERDTQNVTRSIHTRV